MSATEITERERLEELKSRLESELQTLDENPEKWVQERQTELESVLNDLSAQKGPDRNPTNPDNQTVWEYRRNQYMELRNNQSKCISNKRQRLKAKLERTNNELEDL